MKVPGHFAPGSESFREQEGQGAKGPGRMLLTDSPHCLAIRRRMMTQCVYTAVEINVVDYSITYIAVRQRTVNLSRDMVYVKLEACYKNAGTIVIRFVTNHTFDRWDGQTDG